VPKKILVVDDTKSIREIVSYLLRSRGYEVIEAADGQDAWEKATTEGPDLIVLDAMIPKKTGFEICEELKNDERWKNIPILMLTAITRDSGKTDEYWREKSKADDFVSKPFKAPDLVQRVLRLLGPADPPPAG
jgi:two-component system alkaline phosphatase synthesis response regulator PhoP